MTWTLVEPGVAITAASLITIRPLLRALHFRGFESNNTNNNNNYPSHSQPAIGTNNLSRRSGLPYDTWQTHSFSSRPSTETKVPERSWRMDSMRSITRAVRDDSGSEEYILGSIKEGGIKRTVDVTITSPAAGEPHS
jgi:hypothetical protein